MHHCLSLPSPPLAVIIMLSIDAPTFRPSGFVSLRFVAKRSKRCLNFAKSINESKFRTFMKRSKSKTGYLRHRITIKNANRACLFDLRRNYRFQHYCIDLPFERRYEDSITFERFHQATRFSSPHGPPSTITAHVRIR